MEQRLAARATAYLAVPTLPALEHYRPEEFDAGVPLKHALPLAFLKGFFQQVFARVSRPLRIILSSGDFYKAENRNQLNDALAYLGLIEENINSLESRLAKEGDLGMELADAKAERRNPAVRLRRVRRSRRAGRPQRLLPGGGVREKAATPSRRCSTESFTARAPSATTRWPTSARSAGQATACSFQPGPRRSSSSREPSGC